MITSTGSKAASSGGPAANRNCAGSSVRSVISALHTVPNPARGVTLICSEAAPDRSAKIARHDAHPSASGGLAARNRGRWRATRGTRRIVRIVRRDHVDARSQWNRIRPPPSQPSDDNRVLPVGQDQVETPETAGVQRHHRLRRLSRASLPQRDQGQFTAGAFARCGTQTAGPIQHAGDNPRGIQPKPRTARGPITTPDDSGPERTRGIPCAGQHLIAIGAKTKRPGSTRPEQQYQRYTRTGCDSEGRS